MKIRKATEQDKKEAIKIAKQLKEWFTKIAIRDMKIDFKLNNLTVAVDKNKVLGFLCYTSYNGRMQLIWMGVKKGIHRKGVGQSLLDWLIKESKKFKLRTIELETLSDRYNYEPYKKTRGFYFKNGFKKIFEKKARIKGGDKEILMEKKI